jgi:hypothetical protein
MDVVLIVVFQIEISFGGNYPGSLPAVKDFLDWETGQTPALVR